MNDAPGHTDLMVSPEAINEVELSEDSLTTELTDKAIDSDVPVEEFEEFKDLKLIPFDDPRIHTPCVEFDFEKEGVAKAKALAKVLLEKQLEWRGIGLSANQVGLPYKVFTMGTKDTNLVLFNPEVKGVSKEQTTFREGCLTFPGLNLTLKRPAECVIAYQDAEGNKVVQQFPGMAARIALHEYDHMNGLDFTVHASPFKVKWELDKLRKFAKRAAKAAAIQQQRGQRGISRTAKPTRGG